MEAALYAEYREARAKGKWWLNTRAKQLLKDHYPGKDLKCSDQRFMRFCQQYGVAVQRKTHAAQTDEKQLTPAITKFHSKLLCVCRRGAYQTNWLMFPQVVLVRFNLLMFLLISHLTMLLDNSLRSILRRTCISILKGKSVPLKGKY